jgi:hypothetical protein
MQIGQKMRTRRMQEWTSLTYAQCSTRVSIRNEKKAIRRAWRVKWSDSKPPFNGMNVLPVNQKLTVLPIVPVIIHSPDNRTIST